MSNPTVDLFRSTGRSFSNHWASRAAVPAQTQAMVSAAGGAMVGEVHRIQQVEDFPGKKCHEAKRKNEDIMGISLMGLIWTKSGENLENP